MAYDPNRPGRTGESTLLDLPCPSCGNRHLLCYLLTDEQGRHQHTHYVCTYWGAVRACGWHGWTVPTELDPPTTSEALMTNPSEIDTQDQPDRANPLVIARAGLRDVETRADDLATEVASSDGDLAVIELAILVKRLALGCQVALGHLADIPPEVHTCDVSQDGDEYEVECRVCPWAEDGFEDRATAATAGHQHAQDEARRALLITQPTEQPAPEHHELTDEWVGALVRLKGNPIEGHDRIGTVQRLDGDSWAVVAGQFTQGYTRRYPLAALERIQIVVLP